MYENAKHYVQKWSWNYLQKAIFVWRPVIVASTAISSKAQNHKTAHN